MRPHELATIVERATLECREAGEMTFDTLPEIVLERPRQEGFGDYATTIAMHLAKAARQPPRTLAALIAARLSDNPAIAAVDVAGPGFINITLEAQAQGSIVVEAVELEDAYGRSDVLSGQSINVEFISANPTGPLHLGHTRWAAVGDALARVLAAAGADVTREFYVNDRGVQMDRFGASLAAAATGQAIPEDGYHGSYIVDLASAIVAEHPSYVDLDPAEQLIAFREAGYERQLAAQQRVLELFGTVFDVWYSERDLHTSGAVERGLEALSAAGHTFEKDGALWLRTTDFGDDRDRVLEKSNGDLTYFASDSAYYVDKRQRGFDVCIYLLGADHHGYVGRLKAIAACAGDDPETNIEVLIGQLVKIMRNGKEVRLSKRAGEVVTLEDLIAEVGVDAARYSLTRYPVDSPLTLDLDVLVKQSNDNPVYYVQYAHARISSVLRHAADLNIRWRDMTCHPELLDSPRERDLTGAIAAFGDVVRGAAELREPHRIARYLEDLATAYHKFYDSHRVLPMSEQPAEDINIARLWLCAAARQTVRNGLDLLGVSAPERM